MADSLLHYHIVSSVRERFSNGKYQFCDGLSLHGESESPPATYTDVPSPVSTAPTSDGFVNPVLTAKDITDYGDVTYVADPFLLLSPETWQLYFEVYNQDRDPSAVIGRATSRNHGATWTYDGVVLNPDVHVSFPYIFRWDSTVWMVPNLDPSGTIGDVVLYRSEDNGKSFQKHATLAEPTASPTDRVIFRWQGRWWLLVSVAGVNRELHVYHSDELRASDWTPHEQNPVVVDKPRTPGGRPVIWNGEILLFVQNGENYYGNVVETVQIQDLSLTTYTDSLLERNPILSPSESALGWNSGRMHTFDPWYTGDRWICAVDGDTALGNSFVGPHWSIGLYSIEPASE